MSEAFCLSCENKKNCGEICPTLEKRLRQRDIAGYSQSHLKRKERVVSPQVIEGLANKRVFELRYGKAYFKGRRGQQSREE